MNGQIICGTPIAVDYWRSTGNCCNGLLHFLSHLHADHIVGLTSNWSQPIYTSPLNAKLLLNLFNINICPSLVKTLEIGSPHSISINKNDSICVTLIDANHCPGAVMFLFQGYFGNVFYTADFRYNSKHFHLVPSRIDRLYLDNTSCYPKNNHPCREDATDAILNIIDANPDKRVVFGLRKLGKEKLLLRVASHLKSLVKVDSQDYKKMQLLGIERFFVNEDCEQSTRIFVRPFNGIFKTSNSISNSIRIVPTSLLLGEPKSSNLYIVPYSDHSNFDELTEFVKRIRPRRLFPIVKNKSIVAFQHLLDPTPDESLLTTEMVFSTFSSVNSDLTPTKSKRKTSYKTVLSKKLTTLSRKNKAIEFVDEDSDEEVIVV